ncbi:hypothetical protein RJ639_036927 [Escallonia herrerae]|uniref:Reverse transcriptase RNase H-like domain-containing protein n=1 Tax=Escallonia herrerae TaxID=1293975 RepID=A0AA89BA58_9ASTE|nr:hypothetical protein RJ639_036927 [Escallonia herrerae]
MNRMLIVWTKSPSLVSFRIEWSFLVRQWLTHPQGVWSTHRGPGCQSPRVTGEPVMPRNKNFLFDMEQYFRATRVDLEETKVSMAAMYLVGDDKLWWQKKYVEIEEGSYVINTWEILKHELKSQFFQEHRIQRKESNVRMQAHQITTPLHRDPIREGIQAGLMVARNQGVKRQSQGGQGSWASNSSTKKKNGVRIKAKSDASTSGEVRKSEENLSGDNPKDTMSKKKAMYRERLDVCGHQGGILMQEYQHVAYESRKLNKAKSHYTTHEKELLAVVHCLKVWRHYLLSSSIVVWTDNTTVSQFLSQSKLTSKQGRWQELLAEFNFMLEYRASSTNSIADALSRRAELDQLALTAMNAIVRADSRVAINIKKKTKKALIKDLEAQQLLKLDKVECRKKAGLLQPLPVPIRPWESVSLDFITGLPNVEDLGTILVVVDQVNKYASFIASPKYCSAEEIAQLFSSTGKSAFEIVNGQQSLLPHTVNVPNTGKSLRAASFSEEWRQNIDLAHSYLKKAARRMKKHADKNRRSQESNVGDKVMVKLEPHDRKFLRGRDSRLLRKCEGLLTIVKKIGKMAYKATQP